MASTHRLLALFAAALLLSPHSGCFYKAAGDEAEKKAETKFQHRQDFSTDPGWTTGQPDQFYWDSAAQTYFMHEIGGPVEGDYGVVDLAPLGWKGGSFRLTFDFCLNSSMWGTRVGLGLFDSTLLSNMGAGYFLHVSFGNGDGGPSLDLAANPGDTASYEGADAHVLGEWVNLTLEYDAEAGEALLVERQNGVVIRSLYLDGVGPFPDDWSRLGYSHAGDDLCPGQEAMAHVDNIVFTAR